MTAIADTLSQGAKRFFSWWGGELVGLLPRWAGDAFTRRPGALLLLVAPGKAALFLRKRDGLERLAEVSKTDAEPSAGDVHGAMGTWLRKRRVPLIALVPDDQSLRPRLSLPLAAADAPREAVRYQISRISPFRDDEVVFEAQALSKNVAEKKVDVDVVLVPKAAVDAARARATAWGLTIDRVALAPRLGHETEPLVYLDAAAPMKRTLAARLIDPALIFIFAILVAGLIAAPYWKQQATIDRLNSEIALVKPAAEKASALRRDVERAALAGSRVVDAKAKSPEPLEVLARLAKVLPDGVWLTEFRMQGNAVTIAGAAPDAAQLLSIVDKARGFGGAKFATATNRDQAFSRDRFSIVFTVSSAP